MVTHTTASRKQLLTRIEALACTLDERDGGFNVDPPRGKRFNANRCHTLAYYFRGWVRGELYAAVLADLRDGLDDCDEPACDVCETV